MSMQDRRALGKPANEDLGRQHALLLVMADPLVRTTVARYLQSCGRKVVETASSEEALGLKGMGYDAALTKLHIPGPVDGFSLAQRIHRRHPDRLVVLSLSYRHVAHDIAKLRSHIPALRMRFDQAELRRRLDASMRRAKRASIGPR